MMQFIGVSGDNIYFDSYIEKQDVASFFENLITQFLLLIGKVIYAILCIAIEEDFSIEKVIFNDYTNIRLAFFTNDVTGASNENKFIEDSGIRDVLNEFFKVFSAIAVVVYLIILVYMGIRILLGSTAEKGSKYKEFILYWLEGVLILFLFPYIMKYSIQLNNAFVSFLYENKNNYISLMDSQPEAKPIDSNLDGLVGQLDEVEKQLTGTDYMSIMYKKAKNEGWLICAICWWVMFFQIIGFLFVYFKRVLVTMFLIAVFPLVMISYAIDKIGDAKSQAFDNWIKEFMLNVFVQSFHAITYVLIMSIVSMLIDDPSDNWLLMLIALSFVSKGDNILRAMFSLKGSADSVKGIGASFAKGIAMTQAINTVRGIKNNVTNPDGLGMQAYNKASQLHQKAWNHADDKVSRTSAKLKYDKLENSSSNSSNATALPDTATKQEKEKDIKDSIDVLLGKKAGGATDDEIRDAADKLVGYLNMDGNEEVQSILDEAASNLSEEEKQKLDNLLMQNAYVNGLKTGGKEINIRQNIDLVLSLLQRDANGNLTPESKAILNKIANSEVDLQVMKLFGGGMKFNKDNVVEINSNESNRGNNRVGNNQYFTQREEQLRMFKGRGKARENKAENKDAKSQLEAIMKSSGSTLTNYSAKNTNASKKAKRTVQRTTQPGQERFGQKMQEEANKNREQMNGNGQRKSKFKKLKLKNDSKAPKYKEKQEVQTSRSENITTREKMVKYVEVTSDLNQKASNNLTTAYDGNQPKKRVFKMAKQASAMGVQEKQQKEKIVTEIIDKENADKKQQVTSFNPTNKGFEILREHKKKGKPLQRNANLMNNISSTNISHEQGSMQNAGADIASRQGTAEGLQDIITSNEVKAPKYSDKDKEKGKEVYYESLTTAEGYVIDDSNISEDSRNDFINMSNAVAVLKDAYTGEYTAKQLLDSITYLKEVNQKYQDATGEEKYILDKVCVALDCRPEDYEAYLRVRILNDPDSVGNDKKIIEECKAYVKTTPMLSAIKDRLGYNIEDLEEGKNLKHVNVRDTRYDGITSEEHRARIQEQYERELEKYELEREMARLDKKMAEDYSFKSYAKDVGELAWDVAKFGADMHFSVGVGLGTGFMASGMAVDGKSETLSQATEQIMAGFSAENKVYKGVKEDVSTLYGLGKKGVKAIMDTGEKEEKVESNPIQEFTKPKDYRAKVNDLKDKTNVKSPLFGNRGKKDDN